MFAFYGLSDMSDLDSNFKDQLRYLGSFFSFDVSDVFVGGSEGVSKFSCPSCMIWLESHPTYSGVSNLVAGSDILRVFRSALVVGSSALQPLVWRRFLQDLDPKVLPEFRGFPKFSEGLLRDCVQRPGNSFNFLMLFYS